MEAPTLARSDQGPTVWSPAAQTHAAGQLDPPRPFREAAWTTSGHAGAASLTSCRIEADPGAHILLLQIRHRQRRGRRLGTLQLSEDGRVIASSPVMASPFARFEWQRKVIRFEGTGAGESRFDFLCEAGIPLRTGALTLFQVPPRPFWNLAHMCNAPRLVDRALARGANAIEFDVRVSRRGGVLEFEAYHGFTGPYPRRSIARTLLREQLEHFRALGDGWSLACVDCKPAEDERLDYRAYGRALAEIVRGVLEPERVLISLHDRRMTPAFQGLDDAGFDAGRDINMIDTTPSGRAADHWLAVAEAEGLTAVGLGTDCFVPTDRLSRWLPPLAATVNGRDRNGIVRKVYHWTLHSKSSMRRLLDYGIDGLLVNRPWALAEVLRTPPYDALYRPATSRDSQFIVHGRKPA